MLYFQYSFILLPMKSYKFFFTCKFKPCKSNISNISDSNFYNQIFFFMILRKFNCWKLLITLIFKILDLLENLCNKIVKI